MSSSSQVSLTSPIQRKSRRLIKNLSNGQAEIKGLGWLNETITIKFGGEAKTFNTVKSAQFDVSKSKESIQLFKNEQNPDVIQYAITNEKFIQKLKEVACDLGFVLDFGHAEGNGNCLYYSLASQLGLPKTSYMKIKRKVLDNYFAEETLLCNSKFDSGDGENFLDFVKFLENLWVECSKKKYHKCAHPSTAADDPLDEPDQLAIVSEALQQPSAKPNNPFRLLKAVIACVFGNKQPAMTQFVNSMTEVRIHIIYLYPRQMLALTNLLSFSVFFKAIDEYSNFPLAGLTVEVQKKRETSEATITTSLSALRLVETKILRNCLLATQRQVFLERIISTDSNSSKLSKLVSECVISLPENAHLLAPLVVEWNELINSLNMSVCKNGIVTYTSPDPSSVIKSLVSLQQCFALRTDTPVLLLLNLRSSNFSSTLHLNAAARAYNRPIHVYSNTVENSGLPAIYGGDTDAAGNLLFFFHKLVRHQLIHYFGLFISLTATPFMILYEHYPSKPSEQPNCCNHYRPMLLKLATAKSNSFNTADAGDAGSSIDLTPFSLVTGAIDWPKSHSNDYNTFVDHERQQGLVKDFNAEEDFSSLVELLKTLCEDCRDLFISETEEYVSDEDVSDEVIGAGNVRKSEKEIVDHATAIVERAVADNGHHTDPLKLFSAVLTLVAEGQYMKDYISLIALVCQPNVNISIALLLTNVPTCPHMYFVSSINSKSKAIEHLYPLLL
jgi:hypothetical protein